MGVKYIEDINDEEMDKWIANLRSGQFTQTQGLLYRDATGGMCCLGVQAYASGATKDHENNGLNYEGKSYYFLPPQATIAKLNLPIRFLDPGSSGSMSVRVKAAKGEAEYRNEGGYIGVTTLNDHVGLDFNQIADRLEETFLRDEFKS